MKRVFQVITLLAVILSLAAPAAAQREKPPKEPPKQKNVACDSSPQAAVDCFVQHAVKTGLVQLPPDMSLDQFRAWGVSVAEMLREPGASVLALGLASAVADALPPVSVNGLDKDASAQAAAVDAIVESAITTRLLVLPAGASAADAKRMVSQMAERFASYNGPNFSSGTVFRMLDAILLNATGSTGRVDWGKVNESIAQLVDALAAAGLLTLPPGTTVEGVRKFAQDTALAVYNYKLATGQSRLLASR
jgi:hypothetical protein